MTNRENPSKGRNFQHQVQSSIENYFGQSFIFEQALAVGQPSKLHKFDLVSFDKKIVVEVKNHSWTVGGNVPSAKMAVLNEAILLLQKTTHVEKKVLLLRRDVREKNGESLAEYYVRTYQHLLDDIIVMEFDTNAETLKVVYARSQS